MNSLIKCLHFVVSKSVPAKGYRYVDNVIKVLNKMETDGVNDHVLFCGVILHRVVVEECSTNNQVWLFFEDDIADLVKEYTNYTYKRVKLEDGTDRLKTLVKYVSASY